MAFQICSWHVAVILVLLWPIRTTETDRPITFPPELVLDEKLSPPNVSTRYATDVSQTPGCLRHRQNLSVCCVQLTIGSDEWTCRDTTPYCCYVRTDCAYCCHEEEFFGSRSHTRCDMTAVQIFSTAFAIIVLLIVITCIVCAICPNCFLYRRFFPGASRTRDVGSATNSAAVYETYGSPPPKYSNHNHLPAGCRTETGSEETETGTGGDDTRTATGTGGTDFGTGSSRGNARSPTTDDLVD